jgi:hypothetical protein
MARESLGKIFTIIRLILIICVVAIGIVNIIILTQLQAGIEMLSEGSDLNALNILFILIVGD